MNKSLFFGGAEGHLSRTEIIEYRTRYGAEFSELGYSVLDPTLGKNIDDKSLEQVIREDLFYVESSHIAVFYLPRISDGSLREMKVAKENKILVFGFTDKGNNPYPEARE